ncbi:MAG: transposase [Chloroflexota bacterium]
MVDRLYPGKRQLDRCLQELVLTAEDILDLNPGHRLRTMIRVDAGGGRDEDLNWLLNRGYLLLGKVKHGGRATKLCRSVSRWYPDPQVPHREVGWVAAPHAYDQPTRQVGLRHRQKNGEWSYHVLVFNLTDAQLFEVAGQAAPANPVPAAVLWAAVAAYDNRGGAAETSLRGSKEGLGITKRNKKRLAAQEMLVLLAQLAYNLIAWTRDGLAACLARWRSFGMLRMVRDAFHISGQITVDEQGHIRQILLNQAHGLALSFVQALAPFLARDGTVVNLGQI